MVKNIKKIPRMSIAKAGPFNPTQPKEIKENK